MVVYFEIEGTQDPFVIKFLRLYTTELQKYFYMKTYITCHNMWTTCNVKETDAKYLKINCISQISLDNKQRIYNYRKLHANFMYTGSLHRDIS